MGGSSSKKSHATKLVVQTNPVVQTKTEVQQHPEAKPIPENKPNTEDKPKSVDNIKKKVALKPKVEQTKMSNKINYLAVGKTGNGKSASCNAIAGVSGERSVFTSYSSSTAITKTVANYRINRWGKEISITDTPGLADPDLDVIGNVKFAKKTMINAMKICPDGIHVFLIVVNYICTFTEEEFKVVEVLKEIFGAEMFNFTIFIFTHGDNFDREHDITNEHSSQKQFKDWCAKQGGNLKLVLELSKFRAVLFHNSKDYEDKRDIDMIELQKQTEEIINEGNIYTSTIFQKCQNRRDRITLNLFLGDLKEKINIIMVSLKTELKLITCQESKMIERIEDVLSNGISYFPDSETLMHNLDDLKAKLNDLKEKLKVKMKNREKCQLYSNARDAIDTPFFQGLKSLSEDLYKVIRQEWHKEELRLRAMGLKNYIDEEDLGTGKLKDEMEQINYFLSELNDLDTQIEGVFTEIR